MMHFVRAFSIMRALWRKAYRYRRGSKLWKIVYIKNIFENGWWEDAYPSTYLLGSTPSHKLQKPSKESGIFQSLGTINFYYLLLKNRVKRGGPPAKYEPHPPPLLNALLTALHLFRDMIIIGKESTIVLALLIN